jgi:hypothetical protein
VQPEVETEPVDDQGPEKTQFLTVIVHDSDATYLTLLAKTQLVIVTVRR